MWLDSRQGGWTAQFAGQGLTEAEAIAGAERAPARTEQKGAAADVVGRYTMLGA